jgi:predicted O-methyltransferase YrrM
MSYAEIPGYSGFLWLYDDFVKTSAGGEVVVEVGVALGHSIAHLARRALDAGRPIEIWAVDPWGGYARNGEQQEKLGDARRGDFSLFLDMMTKHAPDELDMLRVVRADSVRAARLFRKHSVDLVMIDAAHDEASVAADIEIWQSRVRPGGLLAGDDHEPHYPGVQAACLQAFGPSGYSVTGSTWWRRM